MIEGWAKLGTEYHYCQLNQIGGCGVYRALCGKDGWIVEVVPLSQARPHCRSCVHRLEQGEKMSESFALVSNAQLPPGQLEAKRWPVIHLGKTPNYNGNYSLSVDGLVSRPFTTSVDGLAFLPTDTLIADMHCIMRWSMRKLIWTGVLLPYVLMLAKPQAAYALIHADAEYTTNLHVSDLMQGMLATHVNGEPILPEYGGPLRLVIPHLYAWKSPKWVRRIEIVAEDKPGTWEQRGLHNRGDVWAEQRFADKEAPL